MAGGGGGGGKGIFGMTFASANGIPFSKKYLRCLLSRENLNSEFSA